MKKRFALKLVAACAFAAAFATAMAQDVIKIANIMELSGGGATAGTNFKNGVELAVKEINAAGGILGKKIETVTSDTQSNPGIAKGLTQKAIDDGVFAIFGPVFSGSIGGGEERQAGSGRHAAAARQEINVSSRA